MKKNLSILLIGLSLNLTYAQWQDLNLNQNALSTINVNGIEIVGTENGIYYKSENSNNWTYSSGISSKSKSFFYDNSVLYTSSYEKLYKSTDSGINWSPMSTIYTFQDVNNIMINGNNFIAGMNGSGIRFSADGGNEWWSSDTSWQSKNTAIVKLNNIYFSSYEFSGYLQRSTNDTGQQWVTPSGNGIKIGLSNSYQDIKSLAVLNDSILIAGTNNSSNYSSYNGVYFSSDNGDNFTKKINGITNTAINSIETIGNLIFVGTDGGGVFYSSNEGSDWTSINSGLTNLTIKKLYGTGSSLYACTSTGVFKIDVCNYLQGTSTLNPNGNITIQNGETIELKANTGGINYTWLKDNVIIPNITSNTYLVSESGDYKVIVNYSNSCDDTSNVVNITVENLSTFENLNDTATIYPNPANNFIIVKTSQKENMTFQIFDLSGKLVKTGKSKSNEKIDVQNLQKGYYILQVETQDGQKQTVKLMKN